MLSVNFGVKDTDKSVIPCTESPKRDSSIIAIVVYFVFYKVMMVEPSHPYVAPSHCLNPAQRVSETFHSPSDEADGKLCRSCFFALPSRQRRGGSFEFIETRNAMQFIRKRANSVVASHLAVEGWRRQKNYSSSWLWPGIRLLTR